MRALFLFMQFQRQPIWIKEKCHLLLGVAVQSNRFASYPHLFQFCYSGFHIIHPERQMPQSAGFRSIHALRWVRLCEDLQQGALKGFVGIHPNWSGISVDSIHSLCLRAYLPEEVAKLNDIAEMRAGTKLEKPLIRFSGTA